MAQEGLGTTCRKNRTVDNFALAAATTKTIAWIGSCLGAWLWTGLDPGNAEAEGVRPSQVTAIGAACARATKAERVTVSVEL